MAACGLPRARDCHRERPVAVHDSEGEMMEHKNHGKMPMKKHMMKGMPKGGKKKGKQKKGY